MGRSSHLVQFLWVASPLLQLLVAGVMVRKCLHREYPFFFAYTLFRAGTVLLMFLLLMQHYYVNNVYGEYLFVHETGCIVLRFAIIYELSVVLLRTYPALTSTARWVFRIVTAALLLSAVAVAALHHWQPSDGINGVLNLLDRSVGIMQCGILIAFLVFSNYLRIPWRTYAFGIAVGLGTYASIGLALAAILSDSTRVTASQWGSMGVTITVIDMTAYTFSVLIWLVYALLPERVLNKVAAIPEHNLDAWDDELQRLVRR